MTFKTHLAIGALGGLALLELAKLDSSFAFGKDEFILSLPFWAMLFIPLYNVGINILSMFIKP